MWCVGRDGLSTYVSVHLNAFYCAVLYCIYVCCWSFRVSKINWFFQGGQNKVRLNLVVTGTLLEKRFDKRFWKIYKICTHAHNFFLNSKPTSSWNKSNATRHAPVLKGLRQFHWLTNVNVHHLLPLMGCVGMCFSDLTLKFLSPPLRPSLPSSNSRNLSWFFSRQQESLLLFSSE